MKLLWRFSRIWILETSSPGLKCLRNSEPSAKMNAFGKKLIYVMKKFHLDWSNKLFKMVAPFLVSTIVMCLVPTHKSAKLPNWNTWQSKFGNTKDFVKLLSFFTKAIISKLVSQLGNHQNFMHSKWPNIASFGPGLLQRISLWFWLFEMDCQQLFVIDRIKSEFHGSFKGFCQTFDQASNSKDYQIEYWSFEMDQCWMCWIIGQ